MILDIFYASFVTSQAKEARRIFIQGRVEGEDQDQMTNLVGTAILIAGCLGRAPAAIHGTDAQAAAVSQSEE
ncbi:MAG: hypothetical protein ACRECY_12380 [Phyllobacterium sp.]